MKHELPPLPYAKDALAQVLSEETLNYHYGKHERAYIDNVNKLIEGTPFADMTLEEIVQKADGGLFNNAAQAWNHLFYFMALSPAGAFTPSGALADAIDSQFGSLDAFKEKFEAAGTTLFGSGWVWLSKDADGNLLITKGSNAETPLKDGKLTPLLCFDVWEHAYYLDYQNRRAEYLHRMWEILDWKVVERRYEK